MKPSDHPEFFRLPPPPGRSRESGIRLDAQGRFWNHGAPLEHAAMAEAFAGWVARHPDDGRYILTNGYDWTYFQVDATPCFVRHVARAADGRVLLSLLDGSEEPLDPTTLTATLDGQVRVRVRRGEFEAALLPAAQVELGELLVEGPGGEPLLELGGRTWPIADARAAP